MCYFCSYEMVIMKNLFRTVSVIALAGWFLACSERKSEAYYEIIPAPLEIRENFSGGEFVLDDDVCIVYPGENEAMRHNALFLADYLKAATGRDYRMETGSRGKKNVMLQLDSSIKNPEGYRMNVSASGVVIAGASEAGVFYGIQTLRKAIPVKANSVPVLAAVGIEDEPRFGYRGVHLDVCRHFFTVDEVKKFIDMMVLHNMNRLHWHITDDQGWRIEIKKYPKLTEIGSYRKETITAPGSKEYDGVPVSGFYTQEEAREIVRYAAERFITVIPEIDMPGHMMAALASYPELGCTGGPYEIPTRFGVFEEVLCGGNEQTLQFAKDVLTEIMDIFPSEYIHIGGDECPKARWKACPKCQAKIRELGLKSTPEHTKENQLQAYFMGEVEKVINARGRKMMGWDEILEGNPTKTSIVMAWTSPKAGIKSAQLQHQTIICPISNLYFSNPGYNRLRGVASVARVYNFEPVADVLTPEERQNIIGAQGCIWTEWTKDSVKMEWQMMPRIAALSELQWTEPGKKNLDCFLKRLRHQLDIYTLKGYNYKQDIEEATIEISPADEGEKPLVTLTTFDQAPMYYTTDGSTPTTASQRYEAPFTAEPGTQIKAVAVRDGRASEISEKKVAAEQKN